MMGYCLELKPYSVTDHSYENCQAALESCDTVYFAVQGSSILH